MGVNSKKSISKLRIYEVRPIAILGVETCAKTSKTKSNGDGNDNVSPKVGTEMLRSVLWFMTVFHE